MTFDYDMLIVGGGINGTAIARDAAGRGLSVALFEKDDLAQHTSSSSTKLIHGGLRYLEHFEFRLVHEALQEREVLLRAAPHIIRPMRFVLPYNPALRPAWMLRLGLFLYDHLGGRKTLPGTQMLSLTKAPFAGILEPGLTKGFEYSDCWVDDARLVVLNAMDAKARGAHIQTRTAVQSVEAVQGGYLAVLDTSSGLKNCRARCVINAAGPWVDQLLRQTDSRHKETHLRLIKGSHIVTRQLFDHDRAYIFQNPDKRIIFAIPYEGDYTLIGTTDVPFDHAEGPAQISEAEMDYLIQAANDYFQTDISRDDIRWTYSGVRPLYDDHAKAASAVTRDYVLDVETLSDGAPFLSVYGGKITTSRKLAEHALQKLRPFLSQIGPDWTETAILPGGTIDNADFPAFLHKLEGQYPWLDRSVLGRLARSYGTRIADIIGQAGSPAALGQDFGYGLTEAEIHYLRRHEWAERAEDVLWRRTKLGVHMDDDQIQAVQAWFAGL